jgi:hypothetical protein
MELIVGVAPWPLRPLAAALVAAGWFAPRASGAATPG